MTESVCPLFKVAVNPHMGVLGEYHCELSCGRESVILKISARMWGDSENCAAVITLHKMGKLASKIFTNFNKLKIHKIFVYLTIK